MNNIQNLKDLNLLRIDDGINISDYCDSTIVMPIKQYVQKMRQPFRPVPQETAIRLLELQESSYKIGDIYTPIINVIPLIDDGICSVPKLSMYGSNDSNTILCMPSFEGITQIIAPQLVDIAQELKSDILLVDAYMSDYLPEEYKNTYYLSEVKNNHLENLGISPMPKYLIPKISGDVAVMLQHAARSECNPISAILAPVQQETLINHQPEIEKYMESTLNLGHTLCDVLNFNFPSDDVVSQVYSEIKKYHEDYNQHIKLFNEIRELIDLEISKLSESEDVEQRMFG